VAKNGCGLSPAPQSPSLRPCGPTNTGDHGAHQGRNCDVDRLPDIWDKDSVLWMWLTSHHVGTTQPRAENARPSSLSHRSMHADRTSSGTLLRRSHRRTTRCPTRTILTGRSGDWVSNSGSSKRPPGRSRRDGLRLDTQP
jgi:hypothetical protein